MQYKTNFKHVFIFTILLVGGLFLTAACTASSTSAPEEIDENSEMNEEMEMEEEMDHEEGGEHESEDADDHEGSHDDNNPETIPNDGAVIRITSPADGTAFKAGDEVLVEVETENFVLGEDDNHWHVYIDDSSWGMVMGGNHDQVLRGLEPGEHEIGVFMSIGTHEQMEDGDSIKIVIEE